MTITAQLLIEDALGLCGVHSPGQPLQAATAQHALRVFNQMLAAWRLESLLVYGIDRQVFSLTANVGSYTLGVGGTWAVERPLRIERAGLIVQTVSPTLEIPLKVLTDAEYQDIRLKGLASVWPVWLYYNPDFPLGTVTVWPVPTETRQIALYLWKSLQQLPTLTTSVEFPPGYEEALLYNGARRLAAAYGMTLAPNTLLLAEESKAAVESQNSEAPQQGFDSLLVGGRGRTWNWLTGE